MKFCKYIHICTCSPSTQLTKLCRVFRWAGLHTFTHGPKMLKKKCLGVRGKFVIIQGGPLLVTNGVITLLIGGITPFITDRGPPCKGRSPVKTNALFGMLELYEIFKLES